VAHSTKHKHPSSPLPGITETLAPFGKSIHGDIQHFFEKHDATLNEKSKNRYDEYLVVATPHANYPNDREGMATQSLMISQSALIADISGMLDTVESRALPAIERAFLHLQRLLIADRETRNTWHSAFLNSSSTETECEKLGAVHLLMHGIYAFKSDSAGERTDLVLGGKLLYSDEIRVAMQALVLTEWKVVRNASHYEKITYEAIEQADLYRYGSLAGFELENICYLVLISENLLRPVREVVSRNGVRFEIVNLAINRLSPSKEAKRIVLDSQGLVEDEV